MKLCEAVKLLREAGIENARDEARQIFLYLCGKSHADIINPETESPLADEAVARRCRREPLQYIIGTVGFFKEEYKVTRAALIPRPDTEILVEYAVKNMRSGEKFLDICTGSGCIAISTLKNTDKTTCTAIEISRDACLLAEENAKRNGVEKRLEILNTDALSGAVEGEYFALLSNPPYVKYSDYEKLEEEIFHEPKIAFVAKDDGLLFYKRLIPTYKSKIKKGGFMAFEIGYDESEALKSIAKENALPCEILKDYSGKDRVAIIKM